jgi:hypothetical protein
MMSTGPSDNEDIRTRFYHPNALAAPSRMATAGHDARVLPDQHRTGAHRTAMDDGEVGPTFNVDVVAAGPVSRILSAGSLPQDGHSSGPRITARLKRPTRRLDVPSRNVPQGLSLRIPPYLVLLRVGFALPAASLRRRCAFTAPFHPYPVDSASHWMVR